MRAALRLAVPTVAALLLTGCSLLPGSQEASSPTGASPESTQSTQEDLGTLTAAGRPLERGQLQQALPDPSEVAASWGTDPMSSVGEVDAGQVTPESCAPLLLKGSGWDEVKATERARVQSNYAPEGETPGTGAALGLWMYSFDDPYPNQLFDEAGTLVGDCATMGVTQANTGRVSTYETEQLSFPNLGDRTLALRLTIQQTVQTVTMDFVTIKVGHNTISVAHASYSGTPDTTITERAARAALDGLEESA